MSIQHALEGTTPESPTRYERVNDYAQAYELQVWAQASGHAWDILHAVAGEYERGERTWDEVVTRIDKLIEEIHE